jgi:hypothetical protein
MARLNDDAQWIVLMGFIVSFSLVFLAILLNQSTVVGQTTAESVSEFPKEDIRGARNVIIQSMFMDDVPPGSGNQSKTQEDIRMLSLTRQNAAVNFTQNLELNGVYTDFRIHYNNGVSEYHELFVYPYEP